MKYANAHGLPDVLASKKVVVLGCGKVGTAVAELLQAAGMEIAAITTRHPETTAAAAERVGAIAAASNAEAAALGDIVLVTTNDDAIASVVAEVAAAGSFRPGQLVLHMSGALPVAVLAPAAEAGAAIGCAHPLQSFATAEDAVLALPGSVFGISAEDAVLGTVDAIVRALGGEPVVVDDSAKSVYHAAAVMASNYLVAIEDAAVRMLETAGFDEASALRALRPLVEGTARNVFALGPTSALTGPIVRGDVEIVRRHLDALAASGSAELELYRILGLRAVEVAERSGKLPPQTAEELVRLLREP